MTEIKDISQWILSQGAVNSLIKFRPQRPPLDIKDLIKNGCSDIQKERFEFTSSQFEAERVKIIKSTNHVTPKLNTNIHIPTLHRDNDTHLNVSTTLIPRSLYPIKDESMLKISKNILNYMVQNWPCLAIMCELKSTAYDSYVNISKYPESSDSFLFTHTTVNGILGIAASSAYATLAKFAFFSANMDLVMLPINVKISNMESTSIMSLVGDKPFMFLDHMHVPEMFSLVISIVTQLPLHLREIVSDITDYALKRLGEHFGWKCQLHEISQFIDDMVKSWFTGMLYEHRDLILKIAQIGYGDLELLRRSIQYSINLHQLQSDIKSQNISRETILESIEYAIYNNQSNVQDGDYRPRMIKVLFTPDDEYLRVIFNAVVDSEDQIDMSSNIIECIHTYFETRRFREFSSKPI